VNTYFKDGGRFVPTDVEFLNNMYYITTGYSPLDYVLTADVTSDPVNATWGKLAFGGKGDGPGQFGTGHGITIAPDGETIAVADRPKSEIDMFSASGAFLNTLNLPAGSFPCDIDFEGDYAVVGCLHGPDREKGAPIYLLNGRDLVSTIMPKEDLGLDNFTHIHNAVMTERNGKIYIIAQAWNPGGFAVLEQVKE
jgi:DNA-binding beta-propeller fold protein YncE